MIYRECIRELSIVDDGLDSAPRGQTSILLEVQVQRRILIATQSESDKNGSDGSFPALARLTQKSYSTSGLGNGSSVDPPCGLTEIGPLVTNCELSVWPGASPIVGELSLPVPSVPGLGIVFMLLRV